MADGILRGDPRCPCLRDLSGFGIPPGSDVVVGIGDGEFNYGPDYGIGSCYLHDMRRLPYCVGPVDSLCGQDTRQDQIVIEWAGPAFCMQPWCYVNVL